MDETDRIGVYYMAYNKTLLVGIDERTLESTKRPRCVAFIPFKEIIKNSKLSFSDIETISITTLKNYDIITDLEDNKDRLWQEFLEYKRLKEQQQKGKDNLIKFPKDES